MSLLIGLLTLVLVLNCALLALLVLMQLPKKEAGAGLAFGGGASDTLFGAGSGNVLSQATKYVAGSFLVLCLLLGLLNTKANKSRREGVGQLIGKQAAAPMVVPAIAAPSTNQFTALPLTATNLPATTNAARK